MKQTDTFVNNAYETGFNLWCALTGIFEGLLLALIIKTTLIQKDNEFF